jgi:pimeloyl-ACP methyl ester carboxylesterase
VQIHDVVAVLDHLQIPRASFWGYPLGGQIGFGLAQYAPERVDALLIGGASAYASSLGTGFRDVDGTDPDAFLTVFAARLGTVFTPEDKARLLDNDLQALVASAQDRPSLEAVLPTITMPCLLYIGEADGILPRVQACAQHIPDVTVVVVPGCNHGDAFYRADLVVPYVTAFLHKVRQKQQALG